MSILPAELSRLMPLAPRVKPLLPEQIDEYEDAMRIHDFDLLPSWIQRYLSEVQLYAFIATYPVELKKHLAGKHDQSSHGGGKGSLSSTPDSRVPYAVPSHSSVYQDSQVSATYPYVGLSSKAQAIAAMIGATKQVEVEPTTYTSNGIVYRTGSTVKVADYKAPNGQTYQLRLEDKHSVFDDGKAEQLYNHRGSVKAYAYTADGSEPVKIENTGVGFKDSTIGTYSTITIAMSEVPKAALATAMLEFGRREWDKPIFHSTALTDEGQEFAETTKSFTKADDTYTPTQGMKTAAKRALRWKKEGKATGAGTPIGWGRATDIVNGSTMSLSTVKRMYSFFSRHEVDKKGKDFDNISDPSNGRIMWDAWGGDAGFTWSRAIVERAKNVEKHLEGQHDQASHGRKGHIKAGYDNWYGHLADLRLAGQDLTKQGNKSQMVIVEAAGFNGKPEIVPLSDLDPDKIIYRGLSYDDGKTDFLESEVQYGGLGVMGNGTYFSDRLKTATDFSGKFEFDDKRIITAQWKPDAKILKFENEGEAEKWLTSEQKTFKTGLDKHYESDPTDILSIGGQIYTYFGSGMNYTNMAIMQGYDGIEIDVSRGKVSEKYSIVLNRGKLRVAG